MQQPRSSSPAGPAPPRPGPGLRALLLTLLCGLLCGLAQTGWTQADTAARPRVIVVLAGGGAKGFAHLAVLRRLEADRIPIAKIIGTSMGAVIGSLYASGMSANQIESVLNNLQPGSVALDQIDRTELPNRIRQYQRDHPVDLEFGVRNGQLTFARGVSDGQRFLTLLQELLSHVPPQVDFDHLKIPFRAVATRYRDGELVAFDHGNLPLVVRASMAAPGVFAPVEVDGETYVDGGLVANLPVELALRDIRPQDIIVASYLGATALPAQSPEGENAINITNRMLQILIRQNEQRNKNLLRAQDILVQPQLQEYGFDSFDKSGAIIQRGEEAVRAMDAQFRQLTSLAAAPDTGLAGATPYSAATTAVTGRAAKGRFDKIIQHVTVSGNHVVPASFIEAAFAPLLGKPFQAEEVGARIESLYASGNFERLSYQLHLLEDNDYALLIDVNEKTYGPDYLKMSLGFFSETNDNNQYSVGLGLRRPWLSTSGLELQLDARAGSAAEISTSLYQPLGNGWGASGYAGYYSNTLPIYRTDVSSAQIMASATLRKQEVGIRLSYDINDRATASLGLLNSLSQLGIDTPRNISFPAGDGAPVVYQLNDGEWGFSGIKGQFTSDQLDSASFPTRGYYLNLEGTQGLTSINQYASYRGSVLWARNLGPHVLNMGLDLGTDHILECSGCTGGTALAPLYLGGFQSMGAYHLGQLNGDRLVHLQTTYMYRLSDGGLLHQPTYVGVVTEIGDAWLHTDNMALKHSNTLFVAVDSKIGDIYFGLASGSDGNRNAFVQLGRRFSPW